MGEALTLVLGVLNFRRKKRKMIDLKNVDRAFFLSVTGSVD